MRYIGGKSLQIDNIDSVISSEAASVSSVVDLFAGSGVVSRNFKTLGYRVISNDFLFFSYVLQRGTITLNKKPQFKELGIDDPIKHLNELEFENSGLSKNECFIYNNYSPTGNCERMYFQPDNALKIDMIRLTIQKWYEQNLINDDEYYYLLAALINAVPYVSNITGTYGAYLKYWDDRTFNPLKLEEPVIIGNGKKNECFNLDYKQLLNKRCGLLYADPPYNSREYLPNYHILETIARYDYPEISGVTGMRKYNGQKSVFCKKNTVADAFNTLVRDCNCKYILISYNNEGLLSTRELSDICAQYAVGNSFKLFEFDYRRYKNKIPNNKAGLKEQLYFLRRH